jgi:hypothetical protein
MMRDTNPAALVGQVLSERGHQERLDRQGHPCACDGPQRPCLAHFGMLDPPSRARARRTAGIRDFEDRRS